MPQLVVAVIAAAATYIVANAPIIIAALGAYGAAIAGAVVGAVVAYAGTALIAGTTGKSKEKQSAASAAEDAKRTVRSATEPRRIVYGRARVSGPLIYASSYGPSKEYLNLVVPVADHEIEAIDAVWIGDTRVAASEIDETGSVVGGHFSGPAMASPPGGLSLGALLAWTSEEINGNPGSNPYVIVRRWLGNQTGADPQLVAASPDGWSVNDRLTGIAYLYARLRFHADLFNGGIPSIGAEVRGRKIWDPRTGTTGYSNNWGLCILDYLRSEDGLAAGMEEIDLDSFIAAANLSDEWVQISAAPEYQRRYELDGSFTLDRQPIDVLEEMLAAGCGALVYTAGRYRLFGGAYQAPTVTLTQSDFASAVEVVTQPPRRELFNSVRGNFISPAAYWQAHPFTPLQLDGHVAQDGEEIWRELELPFTIDHARAQRIAWQLLRRSRQGTTIRAAMKYASLDLSVWQTVAVTLPDLGMAAKPFRITAWSFAPESGLITLTMQEEQVASYAFWHDELANAPEHPDTTLIDPFQTPAPAGLTVAEELYVTRDGAGVRTKALLQWLKPASPFVTGYDVEFREDGAATWRPAPAVSGTTGEVLDLAAGTWEFRVRAVTLAARGAWATTRTAIGGLAAQPPAAVAGLALQSIGGLAYLRWERVADLDVRVGGRYEIRHTPSIDNPTWAGATSIGEAVPGDATFALLPLKAGTYFVRAVDAGGVYGPEATISAAQATALAYANVSTVTEHTAFSGAKTGTVAVSSTLRLDSFGLLDDEADFDAIADLDALGGVRAAGTYAFSGGIDLGAVSPIRLTSHLLALVDNQNDQWDDRGGLIDDWGEVDGIFGGEADAWVEVRQTPDNPAGAPTWSEWSRLDSAEFHARAFQFRAQLLSHDPAFDIHISELSVSADEVV